MESQQALSLAEDKFKITLKDKQKEAVLAVLDGKDVFCVLPTGYGKSMVYGILPTAFDIFLGREHGESIVICVSPLNSLMMDQQWSFKAKGIEVECIGETQGDRDIIKKIISGNVPLILITPESITLNPLYRDMLLSQRFKNRMVTLAIDEAHCIKTWGDKFRTSFADLGQLRSCLPNIPVLTTTATVTQSTYDVVVRRLAMENVVTVGLSPCRDNIFLSVKSITLGEFARHIAKSVMSNKLNHPKTVVFCRSYEDCNIVYDMLEKKLGSYITYPPGYPNKRKYRILDLYTRASLDRIKEEVLSEFIKESSHIRIIIATTAFGMGIDCPDITHIYHWGPPHSIEEYVQEIGRAGRNQMQSYATLLYKKGRVSVDPTMDKYGTNTTICWRYLLYSGFLFHTESTLDTRCKCCDVCSCNCNCKNCI